MGYVTGSTPQPRQMWWAALAAAAPLVASGISAASNGKLNKKNRDWQEKMRDQNNAYDYKMWQEQNAYNENQWNKTNAYNEGLWNKQNQYNEQRWAVQNEYDSPAQQMARLKSAGLNPNLIYGQMGNAGSQSIAELTSARPNDAANAPRSHEANFEYKGLPTSAFDMSKGILNYADVQQKTAQTNNLEATNDLIRQDTFLRSVQSFKELLQTDGLKVDTQLKREGLAYSLEALRESARKTKNEADMILNSNERAAAMQQPTLQKMAQEIMNLRDQRLTNEQSRKLMQLDGQLKKLDIDLRSMGLSNSDSLPFRILGRILGPEFLDGKAKWEGMFSPENKDKEYKIEDIPYRGQSDD